MCIRDSKVAQPAAGNHTRTVVPAPGVLVVSARTVTVFADGDGFLTVFNYLHTTTHEFIVKREVVLRPGETWRQSAIDETARTLRDPVTTTPNRRRTDAPAPVRYRAWAPWLTVCPATWSERARPPAVVRASTTTTRAPARAAVAALCTRAASEFHLAPPAIHWRRRS